jgi:fimbrial chaperone protein
VGVVTLRNTGDEEAVMQVGLILWPVDNALLSFEPANDLLVTPTTFRLAGGAQQILRVGLRGAAPPKTEAAYRLIIEEVPPMLMQDNTTQMRLVVRHDLPVFVASTATAFYKAQMEIDCSPIGAGLHMRNLGNSHLKVVRIALRDAATKSSAGDWKTFEYLLPGGEARWLLSTSAPQARGLVYTATAYTEQGSFAAEVQNQCR